jgi:zinc protease
MTRLDLAFAGLLSAFLVCLPSPAPAAEPAQAPQKVVAVEGITEYHLANGLRVVLFPDPSSAKVTVNSTVLVGSRMEGYGEAGMAHLLEHMLFKGTPKHPGIPKDLRDRGAQFNATTSLDRTNYFETLNASEDNLDFALNLESDRLIHSNVKREDLLTEMTVVRNEFERGENTPSYILNQRLMAAAYQWHNYAKSTIGNRSDIERVPIESLQAFYHEWYQPDNVVLFVAGNFDDARLQGNARFILG